MANISTNKAKMQLGKFTGFVKSEQAITAASALVITPAILGIVDSLSARTKFPVKNITLVLIIAAIILFVIAGFFSGIIQDVLLGGVIGLVVNALLTVNAVSSAVNRVTTSRSRSG